MSDKLQGGIKAGSIDFSMPVLLRNITDDLGTTGKIFSDVTASYWRQGGVRTAITPVTLASVNAAHSDGGFIEVDATNMPGSYRFDLPDAAITTGSDWVMVSIKVASSFVFNQLFFLTTNSIQTGDIFAQLPTNFTDMAIAATTGRVDIGTNNDKTGYTLSASGIDSIHDEIIEGTLTQRQIIRILLSALAGKATGGGTLTPAFRDLLDTKDRISATVDSNHNRITVVLDGT